ncbi:AAA-associated domain-containing protein, partial [Aquitalea magnusonii]|uniref:AAA-associated domain-containing protein n=1 Tax=Aquitalea magnusonii TaxID=332411 RepID=UPI003B8A76F8
MPLAARIRRCCRTPGPARTTPALRTGTGRLELTAAGKLFADYGHAERKVLFAEHLLRHIPLAARIRRCCRTPGPARTTPALRTGTGRL